MHETLYAKPCDSIVFPLYLVFTIFSCDFVAFYFTFTFYYNNVFIYYYTGIQICSHLVAACLRCMIAACLTECQQTFDLSTLHTWLNNHHFQQQALYSALV